MVIEIRFVKKVKTKHCGLDSLNLDQDKRNPFDVFLTCQDSRLIPRDGSQNSLILCRLLFKTVKDSFVRTNFVPCQDFFDSGLGIDSQTLEFQIRPRQDRDFWHFKTVNTFVTCQQQKMLSQPVETSKTLFQTCQD